MSSHPRIERERAAVPVLLTMWKRIIPAFFLLSLPVLMLSGFHAGIHAQEAEVGSAQPESSSAPEAQAESGAGAAAGTPGDPDDVDDETEVTADQDLITEEEAEAARQREATLAALEREIERIESELGPYDPGLIEVMSDMGRVYTEAEQYDEAAEAYTRSLQLVRVSDGLYSERQVPVLENLIASNAAASNWAAVDNNHHLLFQIQGRLYEPGDPAYTDAVLAHGDWKLEAARAGLLSSSLSEQLREIENVRTLYAEAIEQMVSFDRDDVTVHDLSDTDGLVSLIDGKARSEYVMARYLMQIPPEYFEPPVARFVDRVVCYSGVEQSTPGFVPAVYTADDAVQSLLAQAAPAPAPAPQRPRPVCVSQRVVNPNYRAAQYSEHRSRIDRAGMNMRNTIAELQWVLDSGKLDADAALEQQARIAELEQMYEDLRQESRRRSFSRGFMRGF